MARIDLRGTENAFSEDWLQQLIHEHPDVLPVEQIEPGLGKPAAVCRELPLSFGAGRTGALDNVLMTAQGGIVLVETKLWRNPEARRTVVAQAMEYASAVFSLGYQQFEEAVRRAKSAAGEPFTSLFELVGSLDSEQDEASFVDAVSRNLNRGRAIVLVVGDGIREDILPLANLLQSHAGQRFTFALVELGVYRTPVDDTWIVSPSVLAQTALIERGVIHIEGSGGATVAVKEYAPAATPAAQRPITITEDAFLEALAGRDPHLPDLLRAFLQRADEIGVVPDTQRGMSLKHRMAEGNDLNLGTITRDGYLDTGPSTWWGRTAIGKRYNEDLAAAIGGFVRDIKQGHESAVRTADGKTPRLSQFLPEHADRWLAAMTAYIAELDPPGDR